MLQTLYDWVIIYLRIHLYMTLFNYIMVSYCHIKIYLVSVHMIPQMFGNYWTTYSLSRKDKTLKIYQKVNQHKYYNCKNFLVHNTIRSFLVSWQTCMSSDPFRKGLISSKSPPPPLDDAFDRKNTVKNTTKYLFMYLSNPFKWKNIDVFNDYDT